MFRFLLRFFAVFITCSAFVELASRPVFAYTFDDPTDANPNAKSGGINWNSTNQTYVAGDTACAADPLIFQGQTGPTGTYTLTAQYTPNNYTITYKPGSHGSGTDVSYVGNSTYGLITDEKWTTETFAHTEFTANSGWAFVKWNTAEDGSGTDYFPNTEQPKWTTNGNLTLYAIYTQNYTVTYKAGSCGDNAETVLKQNSSFVPGTVYTGFSSDSVDAENELNLGSNNLINFEGWTTDNDYDNPQGTVYKNGEYSGANITNNITFYAVCSYSLVYEKGSCDGKVPGRYTVPDGVHYGDSYSPVLSIDPADNQYYSSAFGSVINLPENYNFNGWDKCWFDCTGDIPDSCGNGDSAEPGASIDWDQHKCLLLVGKCEEEPISLCTNAAPNHYVNNASEECPSCPNEYPYSDGGNIGEDGCYNIITPECTMVPDDVPVHCNSETATWGSCECDGAKVQYRRYKNGTITDINGEELPAEPDLELTCPQPLTSADGLEGFQDYSSESKDCDPIPEDETYDATFYCDGEDGGNSAMSEGLHDGEDVVISDVDIPCNPTGWYCEKGDGSHETVSVNEGTFSIPASDVNCYARYSVSYYCNAETAGSGESMLVDPDTVNWNQSYTWKAKSIANSCAEKTEDKDFDKWICSSGVGERTPENTDNYAWTTNTKCYPNWTDKEYTITYNVLLDMKPTNTGFNMPNPANPSTYNKNTSDTELAKPTTSNTNYSISGDWYECEDGEDGTMVPVSSDKTPVTSIPGGFAQNPHNLNLCIDMTGWKINYWGCTNGRYVCDIDDAVNMNRLLKYGDNGLAGVEFCETFTTARDVTFSKVTTAPGVPNPPITDDNKSGYCWFNISNDRWPIDSRYGRRIWTWQSSAIERSGIDSSVYQGSVDFFTRLTSGYDITYNCTEGQGNQLIDGPYENINVPTKPKGTCSRPGWTFTWNCGGSRNLIPGIDKIYVDSDKTCNADWTCNVADNYYPNSDGTQCIKKYPLTYVCNNDNAGGTPPQDSGSPYSAGANITIVSGQGGCTTPAGKHFDKWNCTDGITGSTTMPEKPVVCNGSWVGENYTVTYNCNDGNTSVAFKSGVNWLGGNAGVDQVTYGTTPYESFKDAAETCGSQQNKILQGWDCHRSDAPWYNQSNRKWNIAANVKCDAKWSNLYPLTYDCGTVDGNSVPGNPADEDSPYPAGATPNTLTAAASGCVVTGKEFKWNCGGSDTSVTPGNSITMNSDRHCTAEWDDIKYRVEYNCNNDNAGTDTFEEKYFGNTVTIEHTQRQCVAPANKEFDKWRCETADLDDVTYYDDNDERIESFSMPARDVTCTADWEDKTYTVTYDCNGGDVNGESSKELHIGDTYTFATQTEKCTWEGHISKNWTCKTSNGGSFKPVYTEEEWLYGYNVTCTANWDTDKYDLIYNCRNDNENQYSLLGGSDYVGDGTENVELWTQNGAKVGECDIPSGKTFLGWTCDNATPEDGYITMPARNVTCTADWKDKTYTVTYDCNGGDVNGESSKELHIGDTYTFATQTEKCTWEGHISKNWTCKTSNGGSFKPVYTEEEWLYGYNVTCTANWDTDKYILTYDCRNGNNTVADSGKSYEAGTTVTIAGYSECGTKTGSTMTGWDCGSAGDTIVMNSHKTCTAIWDGEDYHVTYNCNGGNIIGGSGSTETIDVEFNVTQFVFATQAGKCTWEKHSPKGWTCRTSRGGGFGPWYNIEYPWVYDYSVICTADWDPLYDVTYNCNRDDGYTNPTDSESPYVVGASVIVKDSSECGAETREGYTFENWQCQPEGGTSFDRDSGDTFVIDADTTCTAKWNKNSYKITYDCNGQTRKSGATMQHSVEYLGTHNVAGIAEKCSYDGYTFGGWECSKAKSPNSVFHTYLCPASSTNGNCVNDSSITWNFADNLTCKALWTPNPYNVTYDCNGGTIKNTNQSTEQQSVIYGNTFRFATQEAKCERSGYEYGSWDCEKDDETHEHFALTESDYKNSPWNRPYDVKCTAQWDPNELKIRYHGGKAGDRNVSINIPNQTVHYYDKNVNLHQKLSDIAGYRFKAWECVVPVDVNVDDLPAELQAELNRIVDGRDVSYNISGNTKITYTCERPVIDTYLWNHDMDCTAQWEAKKYPVTYYQGNCTGGESQTYIENALTYDEMYSLLGLEDNQMTIKAQTGFRFAGWRTNLALTVADRLAAPEEYGPWTQDDSNGLELYALCQEKDYEVEYNCDTNTSCDEQDTTGCRTPEDARKYNINNSVEIKSNTCKRPGYTFLGWNCLGKESNTEPQTKWSDNGHDYFKMPAENVRCTADWDQDVYAVTYDCDTNTSCDEQDATGCRTPEDDTEYHYGDPVNTLASTCVKKGQDFDGWSCDGSKVQANKENAFRIYDNTTCVAQWKPKHYDIVYQSGNCEVMQSYETKRDANELEYDSTFFVRSASGDAGANVQVRFGYEFLGWSTEPLDDEDAEADDFEPDYVSGTEYGPWTEDNGLTLYAVCKKKEYNICYDFQVTGGRWNSDRPNPVYSYQIGDSDENILLATHADGNHPPFYLFEGWYNNPEGTGTKVEKLPRDVELLSSPQYVRCEDTISAAQCDNGEEYAKCDVVLYANWKPAGKVRFECTVANTHTKEAAVGDDVEARRACGSGTCMFKAWHCDNYTGAQKDYNPEDLIKILEADTVVVCKPEKDCSNLQYTIEYHVYRNGVEIEDKNEDKVYINDGQDLVKVSELTPNTYSPGDEPVPYPVVSWPDCRFTGWYENQEFTGTPVTHTPALQIDEEGKKIVLHGQMICEAMCNEPGHEHWLHIGDNENDKVCLYEKRPTSQTPSIRVKGKSSEPYYMMLSTNPDMVIHEGSSKLMRIQHKNGTVYNVCDKSSCPELAN